MLPVVERAKGHGFSHAANVTIPSFPFRAKTRRRRALARSNQNNPLLRHG